MTWFNKQARPGRRAKREREALAASVDEVVAESKLVAEAWDAEDGCESPAENAPASGSVVIRPRLSLQSRPMPAVYRVAPGPSSSVSAPNLAKSSSVDAAPVSKQEQRLAGRSTKVRLQAVRPDYAPEISTEHVSALEKDCPGNQIGTGSVAFPTNIETGTMRATRPASGAAVENGETGAMRALYPTSGASVENGVTGMMRVTRPASGASVEKGETGTMRTIRPAGGASVGNGETGEMRATRSDNAAPPPGGPLRSTRPASGASVLGMPGVPPEAMQAARAGFRLPGGCGVIKQGQSEVMISNLAVSERSVVMVMPTGDPGPVVVKYISLYPGMGFTIHFSARTVVSTPFNYVIWPF